jgi:hypothetical protein
MSVVPGLVPDAAGDSMDFVVDVLMVLPGRGISQML